MADKKTEEAPKKRGRSGVRKLVAFNITGTVTVGVSLPTGATDEEYEAAARVRVLGSPARDVGAALTTVTVTDELGTVSKPARTL